ncbi:MAG: hypothetical protein FJZ78_09830 [Bacteroidetes bacterium]|nr:hypothetical protein [Bacteroidota bacterium]
MNPEFLASWNNFMQTAALISLGAAIVVLAVYEFNKLKISDFKTRYDFMTRNEIKFFWYVVILLIAGIIFIFNTINSDWVGSKGILWFGGRAFLAVSLGILVYYILDTLVRIYYMGIVEKKLNELRNRPRVSPAGNLMRKLSEEEEDAHLEESQIAEEALKGETHSVDYDVWVDEKTGYKQIEKYYSFMHALECPECGYVTLRISREEVTLQPTAEQGGELVKHYKCTFCGHKERRQINLSKLSKNVQ